MTTPLNALILGGSGLIGGAVARAFLAAGHQASVLTRGLRAPAPGAVPLRAERTDAGALAAALTGRSFDVTVDLLAYDAADVARLLDVPRFSPGRYVLISSGQVYLVAAGARPPFPEEEAALPMIPEPPAGTRDHDNWLYGSGKRAAETELLGRCRERGVRGLVLRLPVVQGAQDGTRRLWAYLERLRDGGPIVLPGGGEDPVRFVWAEDVGRALVALAGGAEAPAFAYNLAQPDEPTLRELVEGAARALGTVARIVPRSWDEIAAAGLDHRISPFSGRWCSRPDPARARRDWGFEGTPSASWLPAVVRGHLEDAHPTPHPGYARRALELALAR